MDRIVIPALILIVFCTSCQLPDIGQSREDRIKDVQARFEELASANEAPTPRDLRAIQSEVVQSFADTAQLTAITARHKQELLDLLDLSSWEPTTIDAFPVYEQLYEGYRHYVKGRIPDEAFEELMQCATLIPTGDEDTDRRIYLSTHALMFDYRIYTIGPSPKRMEEIVIMHSHFVDFCLFDPEVDSLHHFAVVNFDSLLEAILAEEIGYVDQLEPSQQAAIRALHESFRKEVETLRQESGKERPQLGDNFIPFLKNQHELGHVDWEFDESGHQD